MKNRKDKTKYAKHDQAPTDNVNRDVLESRLCSHDDNNEGLADAVLASGEWGVSLSIVRRRFALRQEGYRPTQRWPRPFAMRRMPSSTSDASIEYDNLKKPSPSEPNAEPGTVMTRSSSRDIAVSIDGPYFDTSSMM